MSDLYHFYQNKEIAEANISRRGLDLARCEFRKSVIYKKASSGLLIGFLLSLIVCPQFGFGIPTGHGISHMFWVINPLLCAMFCGLFLLLSGSVTLSFLLTRTEQTWLYQRANGLFIALPILLWGAFMMLPNTEFVSGSYVISWFVGFLSFWILLKTVYRKLSVSF